MKYSLVALFMVTFSSAFVVMCFCSFVLGLGAR